MFEMWSALDVAKVLPGMFQPIFQHELMLF